MQLNFCIYALFFTRFIVEMRKKNKKHKKQKNTVFFEKNMFVCFLSKKKQFFPHPDYLIISEIFVQTIYTEEAFSAGIHETLC